MKEFRLLGNTISREVGEDNYNTVRLNVWRLANKYRNEFLEKFFRKFSNMEAVINNVEDLGNTFIFQIAEWGVSFLNQNKIYSYDINRFLEEYCREYLEPWFDAVQEIEDQYNEIIMSKEEAMEYRRQRKAGRGRLVGGGFGVSGAAKGMAMAGAANLATGMAHSAANAVGNIASSISASNKKSALFKREETRNTYARGLFVTMFNLHYAVARALEKNSNCPVTYLSKGAANEADAIFHNIKKGIVPKEDIPDQLIRVISIYPYDKEVYEYIFDNYGDQEGELLILSDYFGCSLHKKIYSELETKFVGINFLDPEALNSAKEGFSHVCSHYGISSKDYLEAMNKILLMHHENRRTYDSVTYPDHETVERVREEIKNLVDRVEKLSGNNEELIRSIIQETEGLRCETKEKYLNYLRDALEKADSRYKTVKNIRYEDRELAQRARKEAEEIEELIRSCNFQELEGIKTLRQTIAAYETSVKEPYLSKLDATIDIWQKQDNLPVQFPSFFFVKRKFFSDLYYFALGLKWESEKLGFMNESYLSWFENMEHAFLTIKGERYYSAEEANKKYYTAYTHAVSYVNYINEKNGPKKGFLSSLKNNLSGVVVKNYESDFIFITNNGTMQMPMDTKEEGEELVRRHLQVMSELNAKVNAYDKLVEQLESQAELQDERLSVKRLVVDTPLLAANKVEEIVNEVCKYQKLTINEKVTTASASLGRSDSSSDFHQKGDLIKFTITEVKDKVAVTKVLHRWMGYELSACVRLLGHLPYTMEGEYKVADAKLIREQFEAAGATVKYTLASDPDAPESNRPE